MAVIEFKIDKEFKEFVKGATTTDKALVSKSMRATMGVWLSRIRADARDNIDLNKTTFTGELKADIGTDIINDWKGEVGTSKIYAPPIEYGRTAGKMPPSSALEKWARIKLGVPNKRVKSVAYLIARKIKQRGTTAKPFLEPALDGSRTFGYDLTQRALNRIALHLIGAK